MRGLHLPYYQVPRLCVLPVVASHLLTGTVCRAWAWDEQRPVAAPPDLEYLPRFPPEEDDANSPPLLATE